jgi:signal transduction histidine kinase
MRKAPRKTRDGQTRTRFDRALAITLISATGLLVILGLVFSIAQGSQQITTRAGQLHNADESLRAATVVRAQLGLAVYLTRIDDEYGTNSQGAIDVSVEETTTASNDLATGVEELESHGMHDAMSAIEAASSYQATTAAVLRAIEDKNADLAADLWSQHDAEFKSLVANFEGLRDELRDEVNESDVFLGRIGTLTRFLVAFLVPAAVIFIYRELLLRQHRQTELEGRLESERRLSRAREDFIANASHELRTPLTGISGLAQILAEDPTIASSESASELLHLILSESNDLSRMVEDLLTTARLDAGALHFDFEELSISEIVSDVAEPLVRAGLSVEWECEPAFVKGDALRTRQVLRNLLSNARKYGGPHIQVRGRIDGRTYACEIIDDGEGVPDHISNRMFERFVHRGHAGVEDSVGLGLAIVHALAQGMGGSVRYERRDGSTVFTVRLPLAEEATEFHSAVAAAVRSQRLIDEQVAAEG